MPAALLEGSTVISKQVGRDNWQRTVYSALGENVPAERLLAGETLNPSGNWSSFRRTSMTAPIRRRKPCWKRSTTSASSPRRALGLFGPTRRPSDPEGFSNVFVVEDGDTVLLPKGYHPVVAAPGYELQYTWVLAGRRAEIWRLGRRPPPRCGCEDS